MRLRRFFGWFVCIMLPMTLHVLFAAQKSQQVIVVKPSHVSIVAGTSQQFTANAPVVWNASCGTITASGLYTAPSTVVGTCTVTAASKAKENSASAVVTITLAPLAISCNSSAITGLQTGDAYTLIVNSLGRSASASCVK